ncbi:MAG: biotin-dependent carboxyltransferase family protein [Gemmatimonadaceae bacterium]
MIGITRAPPYLTVQDLGRAHSRSSGVPRGGAMDRSAIQALNAIVGNPNGSAALEWALGGGGIQFKTPCTIALGGARVEANLSGKIVRPFTTFRVARGETLEVERFTSGRFLYIAVSGGIDAPIVLGSRSTYLPGGFGGYNGRIITRDDSLSLGSQPGAIPADGFAIPAELLPQYSSPRVRITVGTHTDLFDEVALRTLLEEEFRISTASDRTGYKLKGAALQNSMGSLPSDPGCHGAVQVPGDGAPIVLMSDAPTVGGYPKIAVVAEADMPVLAQRTPGEKVRFERITIEQSQRILKQRQSELNTIYSAGAASA